MSDRTSEGEASVGAEGRPRGLQYAVLGAVCALVIGVYAGSAKSGWLESWGLKGENSYYNLLVQGFHSGQLNVKCEVPPGLAQLADPYDPMANGPYLLLLGRPLFDLSYYQGRLYLYFGVTPALVLFWPWHELTGHYLLHKDAVVIFCTIGFLASACLLLAVWRRYFAEVGVGVVASATFTLGLASLEPVMLAQSDIHEVAITCGYALTMVTLTLIWKALHAKRGRVCWLAGASLTYGLALGARPSLLLGAVIMLVPLGVTWRQRPEPDRRPQLWALLLAAAVPLLLLGLALMLYNFLRFNHPLEFGQRYQLNGEGLNSTTQQFSLRYLWFNFRVAFLAPASWSAHFPFVMSSALPALPKGAAVEQFPFGGMSNVPFVWLALAAPLAWSNRLAKGRSALRWFVAAMALLFGTCALIILLHNSMCLRYQVEFLPALVWLAVMGILGLERALAGRPVWRQVVRWGWGVLLAFSVSFNLFAMFERSIESCLLLGRLLIQQGQLDGAIVPFRKVLELQPHNAQAHCQLGGILCKQGKVPEAIGHLEEALRLNSNVGEDHNNLADFLFQVGRVPEAIGHLEQALRLKPDYAEAHNNLGVVLLQQGKVAEAIGHLEQALRSKPDYDDAHYNLGCAFLQQGDVLETIERLKQALRLRPRDSEVRNKLAWVLATCRDGKMRDGERAVELAEGADRAAGGKDPAVLDTLAAAYAEAGRFGDAARAAQAAIDLLKSAGRVKQAQTVQERLRLYQAGQPYHEGSASGQR